MVINLLFTLPRLFIMSLSKDKFSTNNFEEEKPTAFLEKVVKMGGREYTKDGVFYTTIDDDNYPLFLYRLMKDAGVRFESTTRKGVFVWCDFENDVWVIEVQN